VIFQNAARRPAPREPSGRTQLDSAACAGDVAERGAGAHGASPETAVEEGPAAMKISLSVLALATGFALATGSSRATTWVGDDLDVQLLSPNPQTVAFNGNFTAPVSDLSIFNSTLSYLVLSIGPTSVTFQNVDTGGETLAFVATIKISDLSDSIIQNVQVTSSSSIVPSEPLIFGDNFIQFDVGNQYLPPHGSLNLDVSFVGLGSPTPVPEPTTLTLFASGLLVLAAAGWAKNNFSTTRLQFVPIERALLTLRT
jgi:hypothetical protein